mmetsp:Transcript_23329/g.88503  ORF Transcript_23329/g.88503 Transcript_23329/m.88503 type:complete len:300 (+) Transcript_23329:2591-3490(+)
MERGRAWPTVRWCCQARVGPVSARLALPACAPRHAMLDLNRVCTPLRQRPVPPPQSHAHTAGAQLHHTPTKPRHALAAAERRARRLARQLRGRAHCSARRTARSTPSPRSCPSIARLAPSASLCAAKSTKAAPLPPGGSRAPSYPGKAEKRAARPACSMDGGTPLTTSVTLPPDPAVAAAVASGLRAGREAAGSSASSPSSSRGRFVARDPGAVARVAASVLFSLANVTRMGLPRMGQLFSWRLAAAAAVTSSKMIQACPLRRKLPLQTICMILPNWEKVAYSVFFSSPRLTFSFRLFR